MKALFVFIAYQVALCEKQNVLTFVLVAALASVIIYLTILFQ
jgi:hypothetical protein